MPLHKSEIPILSHSSEKHDQFSTTHVQSSIKSPATAIHKLLQQWQKEEEELMLSQLTFKETTFISPSLF